MKWTEDPVKIDAYLNEIEEQMCSDCHGQDDRYGAYCDDCATLADFRTALKTCRAQAERIRILRSELVEAQKLADEYAQLHVRMRQGFVMCPCCDRTYQAQRNRMPQLQCPECGEPHPCEEDS